MTATQARTLTAEPNVTPMIDVLLVVLIVFMVAMVRVYHTMDVQLPQACSGVCEAPKPIVLEVLPGPTYRINQRAVAPSELRAQLRSIYAGRPEKIIEVAGDAWARYSDVMTAMDIAKSAGVVEIAAAPKGLIGAR